MFELFFFRMTEMLTVPLENVNKISIYGTGGSIFAYCLDMTIAVDWGVKQQTKKARFHRDLKWASTRENLSSGGCDQHRRRPACASARSDQRLCYSRFVKYNV